MNLEDLRDIVIIVYGVLGIILFLILIVVALLVWFAIRRLKNIVEDLVQDPIRPTLNEVQRTAENVRGASEFVVDRAVHPLIRTIAVVRGVRRGVGSLTGLPSRLRR